MDALYAYAIPENEIIAFTMGKRRAESVRNLYIKLKHLEIGAFLTDEWGAFRTVLPKYKHWVGKQYSFAQSVSLRQREARWLSVDETNM